MGVIDHRQPSPSGVPLVATVAAVVVCTLAGFVAGRLTAPDVTNGPSNIHATVSDPAVRKVTVDPIQAAPPAPAVSSTSTATSRINREQTSPAELALAAEPTPPTIATFPEQRLSGTGQQASPRLQLFEGLYVVRLTHSGSGHFGAWLLDSSGDKVELLANTSDDFTGSKAVRVPRSGQYLVDVSADGPWTISFSSPPVSGRRTTFSGSGPSGTDAFVLDAGLRIFKLTHGGKGHFGVWLLDHTGDKVELLVNSSDTFNGSKAVTVKHGMYVMDVAAGGVWAIQIE